MKKILLTLAVFLAAISMVAQEHLAFKGIPIEGSMREFCQKLKAKGYTPILQENDISSFSGEFTSRQVEVYVFAGNNGENVYGVGVFLDPDSEWNSLTTDYFYYKDLYTRKYGEPAIAKEYNPAHSDSNIALMSELNRGTVNYSSTWKVKGGLITIAIRKSFEIYEGRVIIAYSDTQSREAKIQSDLNDI